MTESPLWLVLRSPRVVLARPLNGAEWAVVATVILAAAVAYCQLYCLLALQQMHGASMPLSASLFRAGSDSVPALALFELGKRVHARTTSGWWTMFVPLFLTALALATGIRLLTTAMRWGFPIRHVIVDRLPSLLVASGLLLLYRRRQRETGPTAREPTERVLPPLRMIEWIEASGNYIDVWFDGHHSLLRMTLKDAERQLPPGEFVQIHRSIIVNRSYIDRVEGRSSVRMKNGRRFRIGDTFAGRLATEETFVP